MNERRSYGKLAVALGLSLLSHLFVVTGAGWDLPMLAEREPVRLNARLVPILPEPEVAPVAQPEAQVPVEPKPRPKPKPKPKPRKPRLVQPEIPLPPPVAVAETPAVEPIETPAVSLSELGTSPADESKSEQNQNDTSQAEGAADVLPRTDALSAEDALARLPGLPRTATIQFSLILGNIQVGQAVETWRHDGHSYSLQIVMETTGAARLFKALTITQTSDGSIDMQGLRPGRYRYEQTGRTTSDTVFDWDRMKVLMEQGSKRREFPLQHGAQDILSLAYQVGLFHDFRPSQIGVATGKNFNQYALEWIGEEKVRTAAGEVHAVWVRTTQDDGQSTDVWIAPGLHNLPVRIRYTDRKGTATELIASAIEADGKSLLGAAQAN